MNFEDGNYMPIYTFKDIENNPIDLITLEEYAHIYFQIINT